MHERPGVSKEFWQGLAVGIPFGLIAWGLVAVLWLLLFGCAGRVHRPEIPGYHWNGSALYDKAGFRVANVIDMDMYLDSSQACIFAASHIDSGCVTTETAQQAYDWVGEQFAKAEAKHG